MTARPTRTCPIRRMGDSGRESPTLASTQLASRNAAVTSARVKSILPIPGRILRSVAGRRARRYDRPMKTRVVILGAGFGGLELATMVSEAFGDEVDVTLIDKNDAFVFGYSKLDVMFGRTTLDAVRLPYRNIAKPGVRFLQEAITE